MDLPIYALGNDPMLQLSAAVSELEVSLHKTGVLKETAEGKEQGWKCCDNSGDLFSFSVCQVSERNGLGLSAGTFCLVPGPPARGRKREEVAQAFKRFELLLTSLGAWQVLRG